MKRIKLCIAITVFMNTPLSGAQDDAELICKAEREQALINKTHDVPYPLAFPSFHSVVTSSVPTSLAVVQDLLDNKADVNFQDDKGYTALMRAAEWGFSSHNRTDIQLKMVTLLCDNKADVNRRNGTTPLIIATERNNVPLVELLLTRNASVHARHYLGARTVLEIAITRRLVNITRLLVLAGAADWWNVIPLDKNLPFAEMYEVIHVAREQRKQQLQIRSAWQDLRELAAATVVANNNRDSTIMVTQTEKPIAYEDEWEEFSDDEIVIEIPEEISREISGYSLVSQESIGHTGSDDEYVITPLTSHD